MTEDLKNLKGLGEKSIIQLNEIGIFTRSGLVTTGPVGDYLKVQQQNS